VTPSSGLPEATAQRRVAFGPLLRCSSGSMHQLRASPRALHWAKIGSVAGRLVGKDTV